MQACGVDDECACAIGAALKASSLAKHFALVAHKFLALCDGVFSARLRARRPLLGEDVVEIARESSSDDQKYQRDEIYPETMTRDRLMITRKNRTMDAHDCVQVAPLPAASLAGVPRFARAPGRGCWRGSGHAGHHRSLAGLSEVFSTHLGVGCRSPTRAPAETAPTRPTRPPFEGWRARTWPGSHR